MRTTTETNYKGRGNYTGDNTLESVTLTREVTTTPVSASGAMQYVKATRDDTWTVTVPVREVGSLTSELISWLEYTASGEAAKDANS